MKNTVFRVTLAAGIIALLISCSSTNKYKLVADETNPPDQNVAIVLNGEEGKGGYITLKEVNGKDINEALYGGPLQEAYSCISELAVPAGNNTFLFNITYWFSYNSYHIKNIELGYYLETGKKYEVKGRSDMGLLKKGIDFYMGIYDVTKGTTLLKEWKVGEAGK